jgi:hypothetical protein
MAPDVVWLGEGAIARTFLLINALLSVGLGYLAAKAEAKQTV